MPTLILLAILIIVVVAGIYGTVTARDEADQTERLTLTIGFTLGYGAHALAAALI